MSPARSQFWSFTVASTSGQQQALSRRKPSPSPPSPSPPPSARKPIPELPFYQQTWFIALLFAMAMGFFSLALFLLLSVDSDSGYTSASAAAASGKEGVEVCVYRFRVSCCIWFEFGNSLWRVMYYRLRMEVRWSWCTRRLSFDCILTMCRMDPAVVSSQSLPFQASLIPTATGYFIAPFTQEDLFCFKSTSMPYPFRLVY